MAFYHFLAIFPSLLVFFLVSGRVPHLGDHMKTALQELSSRVLPEQVSQLLQNVMDEVNQRARSGAELISVCAGGLWAALNGTWAMIYGLNKAYEVEEHRSWLELATTIVGLTLSLAVTGSIAVLLIFCSGYFQAYFHSGAIVLRCLEWLVLIASLSVSFALLYRFGPNLRRLCMALEHAGRILCAGSLDRLHVRGPGLFRSRELRPQLWSPERRGHAPAVALCHQRSHPDWRRNEL